MQKLCWVLDLQTWNVKGWVKSYFSGVNDWALIAMYQCALSIG